MSLNRHKMLLVAAIAFPIGFALLASLIPPTHASVGDPTLSEITGTNTTAMGTNNTYTCDQLNCNGSGGTYVTSQTCTSTPNNQLGGNVQCLSCQGVDQSTYQGSATSGGSPLVFAKTVDCTVQKNYSPTQPSSPSQIVLNACEPGANGFGGCTGYPANMTGNACKGSFTSSSIQQVPTNPSNPGG